MPLKSMTGFANHSDSSDGFGWRWEIRSVNGRGLDVRFRLGRRDSLEQILREKINQKFKRGSIQISLTIEQEDDETQILLNEQALDQILGAMDDISHKINTSAPSAEGLLALPGVLKEMRGCGSEEQDNAREQALLASFDVLLGALDEMREKEGSQIKLILLSQLDQITNLTDQAKKDPSRTPEAISAKLSEQIEQLLQNTSAGLSQDRIYAEAALIAVKSDIKEELDRIEAHTQAVLDLFKEPGPVGRKLEFLVQELAREANTLCAKSGDPSLTQTGLALKTVIDQMREQVLNLE